MIKKWFIFIFFFFFFLIVIYSFYYYFFLFAGGRGGIEVASNFVICVYMPRIKEFRNLTITFNSPFKEECYLGGDPKVSVNWTKDGVLISKNNTLVIRRATLKDKGFYECTAKNNYTEAKSSFWIDVTGKLYSVVYVTYQTCNLKKRLFLKFKPNLNRPIFSLFSFVSFKIPKTKELRSHDLMINFH